MNFGYESQAYCVVSGETDVICEKILDNYCFVIQDVDKQCLKIWYDKVFLGKMQKMENTIIKMEETQKSICISAIDKLICQKAVFGLDYRDAFSCMGNGLENPCRFYDKFTVYLENGEPVIDQLDEIKELISTAEHIIILVDGDFSLFDGTNIFNLIIDENDDREIVIQLHEDKVCESSGKIYLWLR